jgi:CRP/FNR family transcriptional regulator, cyclic AMP receptor protein
MSVRADAERFRQVPLFAGCDDTHLQLLAFTSEKVTFREEEQIVVAGDEGAAGFLIVHGTAEAWIGDETNRTIIGTLGPGSFIGELSMVAAVPYRVNVIAKTMVTAIKVSREVFTRVVAEFADFGVRVHRELMRRLDGSLADLNGLRQQIEPAASRKVERR